jgi:two-component system chemotaxis sensor kinase CheA
MPPEPPERNLEEFLGEAQELTDEMNRILMEIHHALTQNQEPPPNLVNGAFRATHTLKGLAGLFGLSAMAHLSHELEETLDSVRMGRITLDGRYLDLLFEAVELFGRMMAAADAGEPAPTDATENLVARLRQKTQRAEKPAPAAVSGVALDKEVLAVLTEYEEHRLKKNVEAGKNLFFVAASFDVSSIDSDLEKLKDTLQDHGEIITYLPSSDPVDENRIDLEILLATASDGETIERVATAPGFTVTVRLVARRADPVAPPVDQPPSPSAPLAAELDIPEPTLRSISQTVRVDIRRLDILMNLLGEINVQFSRLDDLSRQMGSLLPSSGLQRQALRSLRLLKRRLDALQNGILQVRMVPLEQLFDKLSRVVRKMSREAKKPVEFFVSGGETELDKLIVEELSDPLMHIIRNCIDHGIETAKIREQNGKRPEGMIALRALQKGNHVIIEIEDDGRGISAEQVAETADRLKLVSAERLAEMTEREVLNLIFLPGFTTRTKADAVSGRGVGMDVVKTNLTRLSGLVDIHSHPGMGTKFVLTLPITLAIIRALIVRTVDQLYAVPLNAVIEALSITPAQIKTVENREVMSLRGATLPLLRLATLFDLDTPSATPRSPVTDFAPASTTSSTTSSATSSATSPATSSATSPAVAADRDRPADPVDATVAPESPAHHFVIVVGMAQHRVGLLVDELRGQQDIVIKSLGKALSRVPGIAGATELGDDRIVLVLDLAALVDEALSKLSRSQFRA